MAWARRAVALGSGEILLTSMDGDGTQAGYDLELTRAVAEAVEVPVIASGGAGSIDHIAAALVEGKASAALLASLLHDGVLTVQEIKADLLARGLELRPLEAESLALAAAGPGPRGQSQTARYIESASLHLGSSSAFPPCRPCSRLSPPPSAC